MGTALMTDDFPVLKQNNAFLAFDEAEAKSLEPTACISCGRCDNACPMNLMPTKQETELLLVQSHDMYGMRLLCIRMSSKQETRSVYENW